MAKPASAAHMVRRRVGMACGVRRIAAKVSETVQAAGASLALLWRSENWS